MSVSFFAPIAILMLLMAVGLIVGLIVLLIRSKPKARWSVIAACGVVVAVLLVLGLGFHTVGIRPGRPYRPAPIVHPTHPHPADQSIPAPQANDIWLPAVDKTFDADVYPSPRVAARPLASKLAPLLSNVTPDGQPPSVIRIDGQGLRLPGQSQIVADMAEVLRGEFETARVMTKPTAIENIETNGVSIRLYISNPTTRHGTVWDPDFKEMSGQLLARFRGHIDTELTCDVRFVDKPWVEDYSTFISTRPERQWLLAQSNEFASTQHEAEEQAIRAAAEMLCQSAWDTLRQRLSPSADVALFRQKVIDSLVEAIRSGELVVDKFAQRFSRSYGDVWRQAILLDLSRGGLDAIARSAPVEPPKRAPLRWSLIGSWASTVGLVGFICVVYAFLNLATKGYYAWSLRLTLMVIAAVGVMLLFLS